MPKEYVLTKPIISEPGKLNRLLKKIVSQIDDDRDYALQTYHFFKDRFITSEDTSPSTKQAMLKALELCQATKKTQIDFVNLLHKIRTDAIRLKEGNDPNDIFASLDDLSDTE